MPDHGYHPVSSPMSLRLRGANKRNKSEKGMSKIKKICLWLVGGKSARKKQDGMIFFILLFSIAFIFILLKQHIQDTEQFWDNFVHQL